MKKKTNSDTSPSHQNSLLFENRANPDKRQPFSTGEWRPDPNDPLRDHLFDRVRELTDLIPGDLFRESNNLRLSELKWRLAVLDKTISSTQRALEELAQSVKRRCEQVLVLDWESFLEEADANARLDAFGRLKDTALALITDEIRWFLPPTDIDQSGASYAKRFALLNYCVNPPLSQQTIGRLLGNASQSAISRLAGPINRLIEINCILHGELENSAPISIADPFLELLQPSRSDTGPSNTGKKMSQNRGDAPVAIIKDDKTGSIFSVSFICIPSQDDYAGEHGIDDWGSDVYDKTVSAVPAILDNPYENLNLNKILDDEGFQIDHHIACVSARSGRRKYTDIKDPVYIESKELAKYADHQNFVVEAFENIESTPEFMSLREIFDNYNRVETKQDTEV